VKDIVNGLRRNGERTPSVTSLGGLSQNAQQKAAAILEVLDEFTRPLVIERAFDEIFTTITVLFTSVLASA
jgi:hypothetical protein